MATKQQPILVDDSQKVFGFIVPAGSDGELYKRSILIYLTVVFLLAMFLVFVLPRFGDVVVARKSTLDIEKKIDNLTKTLDALDAYKANVTEDGERNVFLSIPTRFDPGYILLSLRDLAQKNKVSLTSYSLGGGKVDEEVVKKEQNGLLVTHQIKVEVSGQPVDLINFVERLNKQLPIAEIISLSISEVTRLISAVGQDSKLTMEIAYYHMNTAVVATDSLAGKFLDQKDLDMIERLSLYGRIDELELGGAISTASGEIKENLFSGDNFAIDPITPVASPSASELQN